MASTERSTRQRHAILVAISGAGRPLLPGEVLDIAQIGAPGMGIATVYRNLKSLQEEGVLQVVSLPGENARYELRDQPHHHHFQCRACGRVFDIQGCPGSLDGLVPPGFVTDGHELTLYGQCADCLGES
jgi:Fur family transcriptional regulator, ferric uptake regulator